MSLIRSQYPRDILYVIGFSDYASEIKEEELPKVSWNSWVSGTNLHHALMLSRKLLSKEKGGSRQILVITDGEPTSHLEGDRAFFAYPPSYRTEQETLKEVKRCTQEDILINTFMLENSYQLVNFVDRMTRINRGRAFYSSAENLGQYMLVDYVTNRRKKVMRKAVWTVWVFGLPTPEDVRAEVWQAEIGVVGQGLFMVLRYARRGGHPEAVFVIQLRARTQE